MKLELYTQHGETVYMPCIKEKITWQTERKGVPGTLTFTVIPDSTLMLEEGDPVMLKVDDANLFYGFVFKKKSKEDKAIEVTAYDQLRYLKNKDTYVYSNKTAGEVIQMIADDFNMQTGVLENTGYRIASRIEENTTLFDIIQNALDVTMQNTGQIYVLYDDFGKIALKNIASMQLNLLIDNETAKSYDYTSSIDDNTYNRIKLTFDNEKTGKRDVYIAQDSNHMNAWGVLQYFETLQEGENGAAKADALLSLYNSKTRNLSISNALGDNKVRAGCMLPVILDLGDVQVKNMMLVEKCKHTFNDNEHYMDLTLRGGEFVA
ncbi:MULTISPECIES: XkdQ/YqbQ family protein [Clostridiaceae]|uniref:Hydrolase n=1 Tax=Clostridium facile TaxID=2763035 RepID=A0ABR7INQ9_9CLOT|nr:MULTISPECIES: hydrolase [Clostridiaceae]MBC5786738.1 hydrolase [Clostridium facile]